MCICVTHIKFGMSIFHFKVKIVMCHPGFLRFPLHKCIYWFWKLGWSFINTYFDKCVRIALCFFVFNLTRIIEICTLCWMLNVGCWMLDKIEYIWYLPGINIRQSPNRQSIPSAQRNRLFSSTAAEPGKNILSTAISSLFSFAFRIRSAPIVFVFKCKRDDSSDDR